MTGKILFTSGMPRSGSTLLQNLLSQSPDHHCTSTNDMLDMVMRVRDSWMASTGFIAQGLDRVEYRVKAFLRHAMHGFYEAELSAGKAVFDKSRGWMSNIETVEAILGRRIKVIVTVRDLRDVMASFEKIYRKSTFTDHPAPPPENFQRLTVTGRAERLLSIEKIVGYAVNCLQDVHARGLEDRLVVVPYWELTHYPVETIRRVCLECGVPEFDCDPINVPQTTMEDDTVYGMKLHSTRPVVEPDRGNAWRGVLPDELAARIEAGFPEIQALARRRYIPDHGQQTRLAIARTA